MNNKHCYKCGTEEPEFTADGYARDCVTCGGRGSVLTVTEMCDHLADLDVRGYIPKSKREDLSKFDFDIEELDFDADVIRAERDAYNDYLEGEL